MARNLKGVMPALLTPFDNQQKLDIESLRRLVRFNIGQGIDGLYVGGSTGEAFVQNRAEREQVLEIVAEEAKGKVTLIAHVGTVSTEESQQLASAAHRYGFDAFRPSRRFTIRSALKSTAITTAQLLIPPMAYRWWSITSRH